MIRWIPVLGAVAAVMVGAQSASAQTFVELRRSYDAGQYQAVIDRAPATTATNDQQPRITYLVAQSQQKLTHRDQARAAYEQLAGRGDTDPWHYIGQSAVAVLASNAAGALEAANQAVAKNGALADAHFQRGVALAARQEMEGAAAAFEQAAELDPAWADAHYYAGLAYSRIRRIDVMATHFNTFLRLAPQSPQRPEVESIMRTLSGH